MAVVVILVAIMTLFIAGIVHLIHLARKSGSGWFRSIWVDGVLFVFTFISLVLSGGISLRIAIFVSDYNIPVERIMGGWMLNLALLLVPVLLLIAFAILAIRLLRRKVQK